MKPKYSLLFFSLILFIHSSHSFAESSLTFKQPWIAEAPPVSKVLAAYMEISNNTDKTISIETAESEDFNRIEFHRTVHENDIARMQHQETLSIPASGSLKLEPGGYHMMLFYPAKKFRAGDESILSFKTTDGQKYETRVIVKKSSGGSSEDHSHHHHH